MKKTILFCALVLFPAFAFAAGGFFYNNQGSEFYFDPDIVTPSLNSGYQMVGGYGYSVGRGGFVTGGFGAGIVGNDNSSNSIMGGMGGSVGGVHLIRRPIYIGLMSYTGLGGMFVTNSTGRRVFFVASMEIDVEVGLPFGGGFMPVAFAGYRATGNIVPGDMFDDFVSYGPVVGVRFTFDH